MLCPIHAGPSFHQGLHTKNGLDLFLAHGHGPVGLARPYLLFLSSSLRDANGWRDGREEEEEWLVTFRTVLVIAVFWVTWYFLLLLMFFRFVVEKWREDWAVVTAKTLAMCVWRVVGLCFL